MANNTTQLTIRLLGAPEARISGARLVLHDHKARALLYYLAATGRPHTRDYLATFLWSESPGGNARHSLRSSLYHIRQALHVEGSEGAVAGDEDLGNLERQAGHRAGLGLAARGQHNLEVVTALLAEALTLISGRGYWHLHTRIQLWLAETLLLREHITEAEPHLLAALQTAQAHGRRLLLMQGERLHARLLATRNNWPAANALFTTMLERASNLGLALEIARTQAAWGETLLRYSPGDNHGYALLAEARKVFAEHDARAELNALMVGMKL